MTNEILTSMYVVGVPLWNNRTTMTVDFVVMVSIGYISEVKPAYSKIALCPHLLQGRTPSCSNSSLFPSFSLFQLEACHLAFERRSEFQSDYHATRNLWIEFSRHPEGLRWLYWPLRSSRMIFTSVFTQGWYWCLGAPILTPACNVQLVVE